MLAFAHRRACEAAIALRGSSGMAEHAGSVDERHEPQFLSIDDLATLRFIDLRNERELEGGGRHRARYERARAAFESGHGQIVREFWGSRSAIGLALTMRVAQRQSLMRSAFGRVRLSREARFELHRAVVGAPTDFVIAFAHGDELAARATTVLRSISAQRVIFDRLFAAQALLVGALDEFGPEWTEEERRAESPSPVVYPSTDMPS
jgi:hypothetical protein